MHVRHLARLAALVTLALAPACGTPPAPPPPVIVTSPTPSASATNDARDASASVAVVTAPLTPEQRIPAAWPYRAPVVVRGARGMVVSDNDVSSKVGRDILAAGGNAVDAAVATAFALAVAYPTAGNLGGGGFAVTRMGKEVRALDFRETAPAASTHDMYLDKAGKLDPKARGGIRAAGTPGSVAGLYELHKTLGSRKKTWAEVVAPAIALAEKGFVVDEGYLETFKLGGERMKKHPVSGPLFFPNGELPAQGTTFKNPDLAKVLKRIAQKGAPGFYEGATAASIVAQMKAEGGLITAADLKAYKAKWRTPIDVVYRGYHMSAMPPPSSGGITLAMICHILDGYDLKALGWETPEELHTIFEAMRRAYAARNAKLGDPDFVKMPVDELMSDAWAKEQRATIKPDRATPSADIPSAGPASASGPHTTHLSVVDAEGNAVALTTTLNWFYGSGITVKDAGFVLNNEMDDFASVPGSPNGFGLVQGEANAIAPGKRMLSSMAPTIVTGPDGAVTFVAGAAGGPTIITAVFQELSNVIDFGMDIGAAVAAPRFHMQHLPDVVVYEKDGIIEPTKQRLEAMGYTLKERGHIATAPFIGRVGTEWIGAPEPRRLGAGAAAP